jgi:deazaflavin-dependent oxidoreductase (nitroreductase family)
MPKLVLALLKKALFCFHVGAYRLTSGRMLSKVVGAPVLLLTTTGRKTGKRRTWPLLYLVEGDSYVVVASNGGSPTHPSWYLNLTSNPAATIQLGSYHISVDAQTASPEEKAFLWPKMVELYSGYETYQGRTKRQIPLVMLKEVRM